MTLLLARRGLVEYARRPLNLVLLAVVPVIFVTLSAGALADFARALGSTTGAGSIEAASAGWVAAVLAGIAGFYHVAGSREPDRRVVAAGASTASVVIARMGSAFVLALVATGGALVALAARTGIADVGTVIGATTICALIYLGFGLVVGAFVHSEMNGTLLIVFVWIFDVFLGPSMGVVSPPLRVFPLHFPTQVITGVASGHSGPLGDLGISLVWVAASLGLAATALGATIRPHRAAAPRPVTSRTRLAAGVRYGFREYRRNVVLWILLVGLPVAFITVSIAVTPDQPTPVELADAGRDVVRALPMSEIHGAIMAAITVAFLAGLAGLFIVSESAQADRRLTVAGFRAREILGARLGIIVAAVVLTTTVALGVTAFDFDADNWAIFAVATILVALTYAMIGVLVGALVGRLGGLYIMLMLPFIDIGVAQNPMLAVRPPGWAAFMPGYGATRVLIDGAFTNTFDRLGALLLALAWIAALSVAAGAVFHRVAAPQRA